jgi:branched-chain amino acid transport system ATP-binding protein
MTGSVVLQAREELSMGEDPLREAAVAASPPAASVQARSSGAPVLAAHRLVKRYGGLVVTNAVDLAVRAGEIHAVVGPNGAGKSTLLAQLSGEVRSDAGRIEFAGRDITKLATHRRAQLGIARSFQITSVFMELSVLENVMVALQVQQGHSFRFWKKASSDAALTTPARALLDRVGLQEQAGRLAGELSHGQHRQLEIAIALAGQPKLLLLDEPMAGMGIEDSARLTRLLKSLKGTVAMLLVEHDMDAVFALADRITVLVYGQRIITDSPAEIRANAEVRRAYLGEDS